MWAWLWPVHLHQETTVLIRAGRVFHWCAVVVAAFTMLIGVVMATENKTDGIVSVIIGVLLGLIGRGVRYILGNE